MAALCQPPALVHLVAAVGDCQGERDGVPSSGGGYLLPEVRLADLLKLLETVAVTGMVVQVIDTSGTACFQDF